MSTWAMALLWVGLPAAFYTLLLYGFDRHDREPLWALGLALAGGALSAWLAGRAELALDRVYPFIGGLTQGDPEASARAAFGIIAPIEECAKLLVVLAMTRTRAFDEPVDGIVYAGATALGFAAFEGVLAVEYSGAGTLAVRAALAMPGHLCFSALWGAGVGGVWHWGRRALPFAAGALALAITGHGLYDYLLLASGGEGRAGAVPLVAAVAMVTAIAFRALLTVSPHRRGPGALPAACPRCQRPTRGTRFCAGCGQRLSVDERPAPMALPSTLMAFVVGTAFAVAGFTLLAGLVEGSPVRVLVWAGQGQLESLFVALGAALSAGAGAGLTARSMRGARPTLEASVAVGLACVCLALWLALTGSFAPSLLYLAPVAVLVAARAGG